MKRLTDKKALANFKAIKNINPNYVASNEELIYAKLGKLEDLEEQIGCPLDILVRALKDGVYYNENFDNPVLVLNEDNFEENNFRLIVIGTTLYLKDYKKTWCLKEDKENKNEK